MFTGIIETLGSVKSIANSGTNTNFEIETSLGSELKIDQSVSHNGVCLTVVCVNGNIHQVEAIEETLTKSSLGTLKVGDPVNIERCMLNNGRFDGHIVQGHIDQTGVVKSIHDLNGSWEVEIGYDQQTGNVTVEKGSIAVDGVSLTCFNSKPGQFTVAIIPYTYSHTNFGRFQVGSIVNLEFDIIGKYVRRLMSGS